MAVAFPSVIASARPVASYSVLRETFGERMARLRDRKGLTQAELAEQASDDQTPISEGWVAAAERGRIKNPLKEKARITNISRVLGVSPRFLTETMDIVFTDEAGQIEEIDWADALRSNPRYDPEKVERVIEVMRPAIEAALLGTEPDKQARSG